jgi:hypothetical protein
MKYKNITTKAAEPVQALDMDRVEIVIDDDDYEKVELYMLDETGARIEGGTFDKSAFISHVLQFYHANY